MDLTPKELFYVVKIDNIYFQSTGGGICFGGGEPTMNADFIIEFAKLCPRNWKLTIETSLHCSCETIEALSKYINEWIVDVKDMNDSIYKNYTKVTSDILWQLHTLKKFVPLDKVTIKVPLIPHFNTQVDVDRSINKLKRMGFKNISQIKYIEREAKFDSKQ